MSNKKFYLFAAALIAISLAFWVWMFQEPDTSNNLPEQEVQTFYEPQTAAATGDVFEGEIEVTMYSNEGCNCCVKWAEHLEDNGMKVTVNKVNNLHEIKEENGVPARLSSCHTAMIDGYVVEGHVPAEDIRRLLGERPDVAGVAVPGMPPNSPGMDQPVDREYQSILFDGESITVYNTHN